MEYSQTIDQTKAFEKLSELAKKSLVYAFEIAKEESFFEVTPRHLFMGILKNKRCVATRLLNKLGVDIKGTSVSLGQLVSRLPKNKPAQFGLHLAEESKRILVDAYSISGEYHHVYVGTEHICLAILKLKYIDFVADLERVGLSYQVVADALQNFATYHPGLFSRNDEDEEDKDESGKRQSAIDFFTQNMNELAIEGKYLPIQGRDKEIERMIHILSRKTKSNPILVGEAGVGKTAVVEGLAQRIVSKRVPYSFEKKTIVNLDLAGILAGSKIRGDIEERILSIIHEAEQNPDVILFIDEIHMIVGAGAAGQGTMDIANILKPYLTGGDISVIGSTTFDEYQRYFESDSALSRRFQPVVVDEIKEAEAIEVLKGIKHKLEEYHNVRITDEAIIEAVYLSNRYINDRFLPDKAIDILDEAAAGQKILREGSKTDMSDLQKDYEEARKKKDDALDKNKIKLAANYRQVEVQLSKKIEDMTKVSNRKGKNKFLVGEDDVRKIISRLTKIPIEKMTTDTISALRNIDKILSKRVVGQDHAIKRVASALKRARVGIGDHNRPMASFLFLGPTGVGKTELTKTIAEEFFGDEGSFIQIDMSEFMEQHSVSKLIGSPPGYVGFQEGGQLTEKIRRHPYSVVLFDEIEKAHPDLLNILLQILDEGRLQDSKGRKINFRNTIVVMTSNIGADEVSQDATLGFNVEQDKESDSDAEKDKLDKEYEKMREVLMEELKSTLRPEMLNRIDDIIVFRGLDDTDLLQITKLEIEKLNSRLKKKSVKVEVSRSVIKYITEQGFSKEYGARNIRRKVQEYIENSIADLILKMNPADKGLVRTVTVEKGKDGLEFEVKK